MINYTITELNSRLLRGAGFATVLKCLIIDFLCGMCSFQLFYSINSMLIPLQPLSRIHSLLVLAKFASHCGENENLQTAVVANSLAIQALCDKGNIYTAELLKNECEEIISRLDDELQVINKYVFLVAKSQLFLCKGLVSLFY